MKIVEKKILPQYFEPVRNRQKNFELRKDEDDIQVGDLLVLREFAYGNYTGESVTREVKYVLRNVEEYGLASDHCIIGVYIEFHWV